MIHTLYIMHYTKLCILHCTMSYVLHYIDSVYHNMCYVINTCICMVPPPKDLCILSVFSFFHSRASPHDHPSTHDHLLMTAQTPPSTHVSQIISSWPHKPTILKLNAAQYFKVPWRTTLKHWAHWVSIWRIQDPRFPRTLGEESWITDLGSALLKFNMASIFQYDPPWIQDSSQEFRAILDNLGSAILKFNTFQYFNISMRSSPLLGFVISTVFCDSLQVHICGTQKNKTTNGNLAPRTWKACYRVCLGPYSA